LLTLVHGLAITGASVVRALQRHGHVVTVTDDTIDDRKLALAASLGVELRSAPDDWAAFVPAFDLISPAPGVPETHPLVAAATALGVPIVSEIELAYRWE